MPGLSSGWSLEPGGNVGPRQMATILPFCGRIQNSAYRPTGAFQTLDGRPPVRWPPARPYPPAPL